MNLLDKDTEQLISDYIANRLSDEELEQFELELFENVELVEKVEAAQLLKAGLITLDTNEPFSGQSDMTKERSSIFRSLMTRDVPRYLVLALLMLPIGVSFIDFGKQSEGFVSGAPNLIRFSSEVTRGIIQPLELDLSRVPANSFLLIKVVEKQYPKYKLILIDTKTSEKLWSSTEFELSNLGDSLIELQKENMTNMVTVKVFGLGDHESEHEVKFCSYNSQCSIQD